MTQTVVAVFDSVSDAQQAAQHLAVEVGGVRGEIYDTRRESELTVLALPAEDGDAMREAIRHGGAVLHAAVPDGKHDAVVGVMERDGAYDIDERAASWRQQGWTGGTATGGATTTAATGATVTEAVRAAGMATGTAAQTSVAGGQTRAH